MENSSGYVNQLDELDKNKIKRKFDKVKWRIMMKTNFHVVIS